MSNNLNNDLALATTQRGLDGIQLLAFSNSIIQVADNDNEFPGFVMYYGVIFY